MKKYLMFSACLMFVLFSCCTVQTSAEAKKVPYDLEGEMLLFEKNYEAAYEYRFANYTEKAIEKCDFVLNLYNSDGEPVFEKDIIKFSVNETVLSGQENCGILDLRDFLDELEDFPYLTDYFYAEKIYFSDGTVLEDPFGRWGVK